MKHPVYPVVSIVNQKPITTSLNVADVFGKRHDNVLRDIQNLEAPAEFSLLNFEESTYINDRGKPQPMYQLTRDGFTILVMGFTGARAMQFKLAYIAEFNKMEAELTRRVEAPGRRIAPDTWVQIRKSHRGIKLGLRVRLLDICCQLSRLAETPQSKEEVLQDYADLCESMREQDALPAGGGDLREFLDACCIFGRELSVGKEDLFNAYREYAAEEGATLLDSPRFFQILYRMESLRPYRKSAPGGREHHLRGIALAHTADQGQAGQEVRYDS